MKVYVIVESTHNEGSYEDFWSYGKNRMVVTTEELAKQIAEAMPKIDYDRHISEGDLCKFCENNSDEIVWCKKEDEGFDLCTWHSTFRYEAMDLVGPIEVLIEEKTD